jgi:hypothetical protein
MTILVKRETWAKPRLATETRRSSDLSPEEQARAKAALRFLAKRHGGKARLAKAMRSTLGAVAHALSARGTVSAGLMLRAARVASVPLEDVLSGKWPPAGGVPVLRARVGHSYSLSSALGFDTPFSGGSLPHEKVLHLPREEVGERISREQTEYRRAPIELQDVLEKTCPDTSLAEARHSNLV